MAGAALHPVTKESPRGTGGLSSMRSGAVGGPSEASTSLLASDVWSQQMQFSSPYLGKRPFLPITNRELAELTADALGPYSHKQAAAAANRSPEAGKAWKKKLAAPDGPSIINLAANIPAIDWLVRGEIDRRRGGPERYAAELITDLLRLADGDTHVAKRARAILNEISRLMAGHQAPAKRADASPSPTCNTGDCPQVVSGLFEGEFAS